MVSNSRFAFDYLVLYIHHISSHLAICYSSVISDIKDSCSLAQNLQYWFTAEANSVSDLTDSIHKISMQIFRSKPDHNYL